MDVSRNRQVAGAADLRAHFQRMVAVIHASGVSAQEVHAAWTRARGLGRTKPRTVDSETSSEAEWQAAVEALLREGREG